EQSLYLSSYWATSPTSSAPLARRRETVSSTLSTVNMTLRRPSVFGGAIAGSISTSFGLRNFVSSSRPWPSGVRIITMSTWTPSSPLTRSTHRPSTGASPSSVMPSVVKKAIAAARSSTTTLTWSNLLIVMSLAWQGPCAAEDDQLLAAGVRELHAQPETERGGRHSRCGCGPRWRRSLQARPTSCYRGDRPGDRTTGRTLDQFLTVREGPRLAST